MALDVYSNVREEESVYETPADCAVPYEMPVSQLCYETVVSHSTVLGNEAADEHYEIASLPMYEGVGPGGSVNLVYQYVPSKVGR